MSSTGLFISLPLVALVLAAIWLEDGRPIFYIQPRVGKGRKPFRLLKFRTMAYKKTDSRLAQFLRKTALDELPQLLNILKGEMSFVGPRPLIAEEIPVDGSFQQRFLVQPGLTGAAQVLTSRDALPCEKLKFDIWYIEQASLALDMMLILKSFWFSVNRKWDAKIIIIKRQD